MSVRARGGGGSGGLTARGLAVLALAAAAAGCGDGLGPNSLQVRVAVVNRSGPDITLDSLGPIIECGVALRATATGSGHAMWQGATLRWFFGADRTTPTDTSEMAIADIRRSWSDSVIAPGESQTSGWYFRSGAPFGVEIVYHLSGQARSARVSFDCGPVVSAATPPPDITAMTIRPVSEVEPGDTLLLDLGISSQAGLWQTTVQVTGSGCQWLQMFGENLQPSAQRTVTVAVPRECGLGAPANVSVLAVDAALRATTRTITTPALVDVSPPTIQAWNSSNVHPPNTVILAGDYFVGDSVVLSVVASDNHALRDVVWEVQPTHVRDSVLITGRDWGAFMQLPVPASWIGASQLRFFARDALGHVSDTIVSGPGSFRVHPTVQHPTHTTPVPGEVHAAVFDTRRQVAYLLQSNQWQVAILSLTTFTVAGFIHLPAYATDFDITPGGDSLVVAFPYERILGVIDLTQATRSVAQVHMTALDTQALDQRPEFVRTTSSGKALVMISGKTDAGFVLLDVDFGARTQRIRPDAGIGGLVGSGVLERSVDGNVVIVNGAGPLIQRYDARTDTFGPPGAVATTNTKANVDSTGHRISVGFDVYDENLVYLRRTGFPGIISLYPTALSPNGQDLYALSWPTGIMHWGTDDGALLDRTPNTIMGIYLRASPDGRMLLTAEYGLSAVLVSIIELR